MIESAGTFAAINYAGTQAVQARADSLRGATADVAEGKVNAPDRPENMYEESNSKKDASPGHTMDPGVRQGRVVDLLG